MNRNLLRAISSGMAILAIPACLVGCGERYERRDVSPDSPLAKEALILLDSLVQDPAAVEQFMSRDAPPAAVEMVKDAAEHLGPDLRVKEVAWFGEFLRVWVESPREGAPPLEKIFFLVEEDGRLRVRGLQLK